MAKVCESAGQPVVVSSTAATAPAPVVELSPDQVLFWLEELMRATRRIGLLVDGGQGQLHMYRGCQIDRDEMVALLEMVVEYVSTLNTVHREIRQSLVAAGVEGAATAGTEGRA